MSQSVEEFNRWLLSQLKDGDLQKKAQARLESALVKDVTDWKGSEVLPPRRKERERTRNLLENHRYEPDGYWKGQLGDWGSSQDPGRSFLEEKAGLLFEHGANFLNLLLYRKRLSKKEASEEEARFEGNFIPYVALRRLYHLAFRLVEFHYHPDPEREEPELPGNYFTYLLDSPSWEDLLALLRKKAEDLPPFRPFLYAYYGYTKDGFPRVWWDPEGELRSHHSFSKVQLHRFRVKPDRMSFFWLCPPLTLRALTLYDRLCTVLEEALELPQVVWRNLSMKRYLHSVVRGDKRWNNPKQYDLMGHVLRLCEERVRSEIYGLPGIRVESDREVLVRRLPLTVRKAVFGTLAVSEVPPLRFAEILELDEHSRYGTSLLRQVLRQTEGSEVLSLLNVLGEQETGKLWRPGRNEEDSLRRLYLLLKWKKEKKLSPRFAKELQGLIHPGRWKDIPDFLLAWRNAACFQESFGAREGKRRPYSRAALFPELFEGLTPQEGDRVTDLFGEGKWAHALCFLFTCWTRPKKKNLRLSRQAIFQSRKELDRTVALVDDFTGETTASSEEGDSSDLFGEGEDFQEKPGRAEAGSLGEGALSEEERWEAQEEREEREEFPPHPPSPKPEAQIEKKGQEGNKQRLCFLQQLKDGRMHLHRPDELAAFERAEGVDPKLLIQEMNEEYFPRIGDRIFYWEEGHWNLEAEDLDWLLEENEEG